LSQSVPVISVVIPCFNEVGNLEPLIGELEKALGEVGKPFEIIYVDDCSTDGSTEKLTELVKVKPHLRRLRHVRNLGQSAAIYNGYSRARGEFVITMDADLQNDPADIPMMYQKLVSENADAVCGVRQGRKDTFGKRLSSKLANGIRGAFLNDGIHDAGCTFRIVRRSALRNLIAFRALHRFLPTILRTHGFNVIEVPIRHRARVSGVSKYGFGNRFWVGIIDMMAMRWYRKRHLPPVMLDEKFDS
jgi:dolichol-phosphate mannosyltransferase